MLNTLKSLVVITAMVTIASGATYSVFSDTETVEANTFSAGEVDIEIRGEGSGAQNFEGMAPGAWTDPVEYNIYNLSYSLPVTYGFNASKVSQTEAGMYGNINVRVRHTYAGTDNPESWPVVYEGSLKNMEISSSDSISEVLGTNITHVYYLEYQLDSGAGNQYQGDSVSFDLNFNATQAD